MPTHACSHSFTWRGAATRLDLRETTSPIIPLPSEQRRTSHRVSKICLKPRFSSRLTECPPKCTTNLDATLQQRALTVCSSSELSVAVSSNSKAVKVKVCGVTSPEDAALATKEGAFFVGMILWPRAKRSVSQAVASEIAKVARAGGAEPVAVFVDEDADAIMSVCTATTVRVAQLHGEPARASLPKLLKSGLSLIYVMHADKDGRILTPVPEELASASREGRPLVDWLLIDGAVGGSGESYDWRNLQPPVGISKNGWLLAGGLNPSNVALAASIAKPDVVDVSSGVAGPDGVRKDPARIVAFFDAVRGTSPA
eukprot:jgi/Mesvir1/14484/Mv05188-RA.1